MDKESKSQSLVPPQSMTTTIFGVVVKDILLQFLSDSDFYPFYLLPFSSFVSGSAGVQGNQPSSDEQSDRSGEYRLYLVTKRTELGKAGIRKGVKNAK